MPTAEFIVKRQVTEALNGHSFDSVRKALHDALLARYGAASPMEEPWIEDVFEDRVVYSLPSTTGGSSVMLDSLFTVDGDGRVTLGEPRRVRRTYTPVNEARAASVEAKSMALQGDVIPLIERAVRKDGTATVKLIQPGEGSSAVYPAGVLERDGPRVFQKGTKMFWDHPTPSEAAERPEGSLSNLAAELISDARYEENGPAGPGLYAEAKVFGPYKEALQELAPHIGVSIRGSGVVSHVPGQPKPVLEAFQDVASVDFVTQPGAGGKVLQLFEAARNHNNTTTTQEGNHMDAEQLKQLQESVAHKDQALTEATQRLQAAEAELQRLQEALVLREARDRVTELVAKADALPEMAKSRLVESLSKNPPVKDGKLDADALQAQVQEAVTAELDYLAGVLGPAARVTGMGHAQESTTEGPNLESTFQRLGLSEAAAKHAAAGRG